MLASFLTSFIFNKAFFGGERIVKSSKSPYVLSLENFKSNQGIVKLLTEEEKTTMKEDHVKYLS